MMVVHRISVASSPSVASSLSELGVRVASTGLVSFEVVESDPSWAAVVKNVARLSYTQQLKDSLAYAQSTGRSFDLYVRPDTYLAAPLRDAIAEGLINLKFIP